MIPLKRLLFLPGLIALVVALAGCGGEIAAPTDPTPAATARPTSSHNGLWIKKYPGNYTCFKFQTPQGIVILTDPYAMDEDVQVDIITVSHYHSDHANFSRVEGDHHLIDAEGTYDFSGIKVTGVGGHHDRGDIIPTSIIYVFDLDGIRLAQFASQGELPTEAMFSRIGPVDILIIQIYGAANGKLSVEEAAQIAQRLQAKIIIPAHTDTRLTPELATRLGAQSEQIATGELTVTPEELARQQTPKVLVLDTIERR